MLNPKVLVKKMIKKRLPAFKKEFEKFVEQLLGEIAERHETNQFNLVVVLSVIQNVATARVFHETDNKKVLESINIGEMIEAMFNENLNVVPEELAELAEEHLDGISPKEIIINELKKGNLVIHFNEDCDLCYIKIVDKKQEKIELEDYFNNLEF